MERGTERDRVFKWPTDLKPTGHKVLDVTYSAPSLINHPHVLQTLTFQHPKYTSQKALTAMISLPLKTVYIQTSENLTQSGDSPREE